MDLDNGDDFDPMGVLNADDAPAEPDLPDELLQQLEALADETCGDMSGPLVPPGFTLFGVSDKAVAAHRKHGKDPRLVSVAVVAVHNGKKLNTVGRYAAEGLTLRALRAKLPAGTYDLQGFSADGGFVGGKRIHISHSPPIEPEPEPKNGHGQNGQSVGDMLLLKLALRAVDGNRNGSSEMESATSAMVKAVSTMMQMQMMDLKMRLMASESEDKKADRSQSSQIEMLKFMAGLMKAQQPKPTNGNGGGSGLGKFEDFMGVLHLGMQLAQGGAPAAKEEDESSLKSWLLPLADSLGPGLISVIAMMLPPEQRELVSSLLEAHFRAREAEAKASAQESDDPPTVDTEGVSVGVDE